MKTIKQLVKFMDNEATKTGRMDYTQETVNGQGIQDQFDKARTFPVCIFYLIYEEDDNNVSTRRTFRMHRTWYDIDGNEVILNND